MHSRRSQIKKALLPQHAAVRINVRSGQLHMIHFVGCKRSLLIVLSTKSAPARYFKWWMILIWKWPYCIASHRIASECKPFFFFFCHRCCCCWLNLQNHCKSTHLDAHFMITEIISMVIACNAHENTNKSELHPHHRCEKKTSLSSSES